jgi:hypothetical protein
MIFPALGGTDPTVHVVHNPNIQGIRSCKSYFHTGTLLLMEQLH